MVNWSWSIVGILLIAAVAQANQNGRVPTHIWVGRPDGSAQCDPASGESLETVEALLKRARIRVLRKQRTTDGLMHASMCGMPTGRINAFLILRSDLKKAAKLRMVRLNELPE